MENGGSYICNKTTLEFERSPNQLIKWSLAAPGKKVKEGYQDATHALARLGAARPEVMSGLGLVGFCSF